MKSKGLTRTSDLLKILAEGEYEIKGIREDDVRGNFIGAPLYAFRGAEFYVSDPELRSITRGVLRIPPVVRVKYDGAWFILEY